MNGSDSGDEDSNLSGMSVYGTPELTLEDVYTIQSKDQVDASNNNAAAYLKRVSKDMRGDGYIEESLSHVNFGTQCLPVDETHIKNSKDVLNNVSNVSVHHDPLISWSDDINSQTAPNHSLNLETENIRPMNHRFRMSSIRALSNLQFLKTYNDLSRKETLWSDVHEAVKKHFIRGAKDGFFYNICVHCEIHVSPRAWRMGTHLFKCKKSPHTEPNETLDAFTVSGPAVSVSASTFQNQKSQNTMLEFANSVQTNNDVARTNVEFGKRFFSVNMSFETLENKQFQDLLHQLNPTFNIPRADQMNGDILETIYKEVRRSIKKEIRGKKGAVLQNGWTMKQNEGLITTCLRIGRHTFFLSIREHGSEKQLTNDSYEILVDALSKTRIDFDIDIVGLVTDDSNTVALHEQIKHTLPELEIIGCNARLFNLIGTSLIQDTLKDQVNAVQRFIKSRRVSIAALHCMQGKVLNLSGCTECTDWDSQIHAYLNYKENRENYVAIMMELKTVAKDFALITVNKILDILHNNQLFKSVITALRLLKTIRDALHTIQHIDATLADAVRQWIHLDAKLPDVFTNHCFYKRCRSLGMIPVSIAAYLLHPRFKGENLKDSDRCLGMKWISLKQPNFVRFCGEIKKKDSEYFKSLYLSKEFQNTMEPFEWYKLASTSFVPQEFLEVMKTLYAIPACTASIDRSEMSTTITNQLKPTNLDTVAKICCIGEFNKLIREKQGQQKRKRE